MPTPSRVLCTHAWSVESLKWGWGVPAAFATAHGRHWAAGTQAAPTPRGRPQPLNVTAAGTAAQLSARGPQKARGPSLQRLEVCLLSSLAWGKVIC